MAEFVFVFGISSKVSFSLLETLAFKIQRILHIFFIQSEVGFSLSYTSHGP